METNNNCGSWEFLLEESSPFLLGAILNYHYNQQLNEFKNTVQMLKENTCVHNLMKTRENIEELENFKWDTFSITCLDGSLHHVIDVSIVFWVNSFMDVHSQVVLTLMYSWNSSLCGCA